MFVHDENATVTSSSVPADASGAASASAAAEGATAPMAARATGADRCPLCGGGNVCAMAAGGGIGGRREAGPAACWCMSAEIPESLLARIPAAQRGRACVCATCVAAERHAPSKPPPFKDQPP